MARADFAWVNFDEQFTAANPSATRTFSVEGNPVRASGNSQITAEGYLLIQARDVEAGGHQVLINNQPLPSFDLPTHGNNQWFLWMDRIPVEFLNQGQNRITIRRIGNDDFRVANVVISWRESG